MKKIIEALQSTNNIETFKLKLNNQVNAHITKLDIFGNEFLIEYESHGNLLYGVTCSAEEAKQL